MQPKTVDHLQQDYFNSIKVQLELSTHTGLNRENHISIP